MNLKGKHFLKLLDFTPEEITYLIDLAAKLKDKKKRGIPHRLCEGKSIALVFEKTSTRTRCAFEVAGGTVAHSDLVLARFDAFELSIETDDAFDIGFRTAEVFGGGADGIIRNVTVSGLNSLQPFDEIARFRSDLVQK